MSGSRGPDRFRAEIDVKNAARGATLIALNDLRLQQEAAATNIVDESTAQTTKLGITKLPPVAEIIKRGRAVLPRLECNLTWETDWRDLILALGVGRDIAMRAAGTNRPQGSRYRAAIGPWLRCYGFDRIDEGDRSRLVECYENLAAINAWRGAQPAEKQAKLNHPRTVLSRWKRSLGPRRTSAR